MFHRPEMPKFNYIPRYYDPEKEELEKRKAAMGLDSNSLIVRNLGFRCVRNGVESATMVGRRGDHRQALCVMW